MNNILRVKYQYLHLVVLVMNILCGCKAFATETDLWRQSSSQHTRRLDHTAWSEILNRYLDIENSSGVHLFRYSDVTPRDRALLGEYITMLESVDPRRYYRSEQLAYWINLYNALTVRLILDNYPVKSITELGDRLFSFGPWDDEQTIIIGKSLTLNDIEHQILRPIWQDPRIHYAVNCASYSCPNLAPVAYTAENTESLLQQGAVNYVNHSRAVSFEDEDLQLSSIYEWYQEDFGGTEESVITHLRRYANASLLYQLHDFRGDITYHYDWSLNAP